MGNSDVTAMIRGIDARSIELLFLRQSRRCDMCLYDGTCAVEPQKVSQICDESQSVPSVHVLL